MFTSSCIELRHIHTSTPPFLVYLLQYRITTHPPHNCMFTYCSIELQHIHCTNVYKLSSGLQHIHPTFLGLLTNVQNYITIIHVYLKCGTVGKLKQNTLAHIPTAPFMFANCSRKIIFHEKIVTDPTKFGPPPLSAPPAPKVQIHKKTSRQKNSKGIVT